MREVLITQEQLDKFNEELNNYLHVKRPEVVQRIKEAKSFGDLSENSEYDSAREEQAFIEAKIKDLETLISNAKLIDASAKSSDVVITGSVVTYLHLEMKEKELDFQKGEDEINLIDEITNELKNLSTEFSSLNEVDEVEDGADAQDIVLANQFEMFKVLEEALSVIEKPESMEIADWKDLISNVREMAKNNDDSESEKLDNEIFRILDIITNLGNIKDQRISKENNILRAVFKKLNADVLECKIERMNLEIYLIDSGIEVPSYPKTSVDELKSTIKSYETKLDEYIQSFNDIKNDNGLTEDEINHVIAMLKDKDAVISRSFNDDMDKKFSHLDQRIQKEKDELKKKILEFNKKKLEVHQVETYRYNSPIKTFEIVGVGAAPFDEINPRITTLSEIGKSLLTLKKNTIVTIDTLSGKKVLKILDIN